VSDFCDSAGISRLDFVAAHGGGPRILEALESALGLPAEATAASREVFRQVGNVSSVSILFALAELQRSLPAQPAEGIGIGLGPGVSIEMLHLKYCP
jgi:alkylresorcinol/alkylpyrone synthase